MNHPPTTHPSSLLPTEWRERVKNIIRRSKDPLFCLERFKAKSELLLDRRMDREEAAATEKKVLTVLEPGVCASRADDAELTGAPARRIEDDSLRTFKFSPANTPPVQTLFGGDADSSWKFQWKAESPAAGNCWFQWRVFAGLVPGSDHQIQDPGGTIFQRRKLLILHNHSNQNPLTCSTPHSNMAEKGSEIPRAILVAEPVGGKRSMFAVKYEKLGQICYAYGLIGHGHIQCDLGVYDEKELKYGDWIYASPPFRGGGSMSTRGGSRGSWSDPVFGRGRTGFPGDQTAKKSLAFEQEPLKGAVLLAIDDTEILTEEEPTKNIDKPMVVKDKRHKSGDGTSVSGTSNGSAASLEGDRRAQ